mmetsp:Transcript_2667/g.3645  ORF Transcript_2667/g.3645 Transcript_2667/m.3645 type:complete len:349 (-) Transcript_2667:230-1276(-)
MANSRDRANVNEHVEFVVKAAEDLILEGKERSLVRVRAGTPYSCLMLKQQRFSSLFRHYAKHHGLRKEDLAYYFTEPLQNEDTPESVFLQARDEVIVRKRKKHETDADIDEYEEDQNQANERFIMQVGALLDDTNEHCDVTFYAGENKVPVRAHKMILVARSEYFRNMFRRDAMREASQGEVFIKCHEEQTVRWMLEYLYTNRISDLHRCSADQVSAILAIAEEYQLLELKVLCENAACDNLTTSNVGRLLSAAEQFHATNLRSTCMSFVHKNMADCAHSQAFSNDVTSMPKLCISILKHISGETSKTIGGGGGGNGVGGFNMSGSNRPKRRRIDIEVDADDDRRGFI